MRATLRWVEAREAKADGWYLHVDAYTAQVILVSEDPDEDDDDLLAEAAEMLPNGEHVVTYTSGSSAPAGLYQRPSSRYRVTIRDRSVHTIVQVDSMDRELA